MTDQDMVIARIERRLLDLERAGKVAARTLSDVKDTIPALAAVSSRIAEVERDTQLRLSKLEAGMAALSNAKRTGK
jgi:hypothetical protein